MAEPSAILETPHAACLWAALCIPFSRPVLPRGAVVGTVAGLVRTSWTWGWFSQQGSGHGGRSRSHVKDWETPHAACLWAALCIPFSRPVLPRGAVVGTVAGLVRTSWTWGWFSQQGSGHGGRSRSHVKDWRRLVALHGCVHVFVCRVVRCWFGSIEPIWPVRLDRIE
ncbi:hypothetical protein F511_26468 [Dorcoceras hygrometricum]|uniref:Uncharacterized protein n=1 Tax=Dorcoceras hygrometricum TaxID=472368 RepID=A0A2Z7DJZ9_9LAMI|nr:hypothetical protein F511_26468 [Dorcoceras hygrometricum]